MRGLDTHVLVRYLVADHVDQAAAAVRFVEESREAGEQIYVSIVVLCQLVWVLTRSYRKSTADVVRILECILRTKQFEIERDSVVRRALDAFRTGRGDFADYLIGEICQASDCRDCVTFDRGLKNTAGFTLLR